MYNYKIIRYIIMDSIVIDNCVVTKLMGNGLRICSIKYAEKHRLANINTLKKITTGNKKKDNKLIQQLSDGKLSFNDVLQIGC